MKNKLNENHEYLDYMLNEFKDFNISISIDGYEKLSRKGIKNYKVTVSGDIASMDIGLYSQNSTYSNTFKPDTSKNIKDMETYIGQALLKIKDNTSGNI